MLVFGTEGRLVIPLASPAVLLKTHFESPRRAASSSAICPVAEASEFPLGSIVPCSAGQNKNPP